MHRALSTFAGKVQQVLLTDGWHAVEGGSFYIVEPATDRESGIVGWRELEHLIVCKEKAILAIRVPMREVEEDTELLSTAASGGLLKR
jgi:hypothetical protein